MTQDLYLSIKASISAWLYDIGASLDTPAEVFDFDSTAEEEDLAQEDMIGPMEFYIQAKDTLGTVGFKATMMTYNDPQIQRLNEGINAIVNKCAGKVVVIPILHYDTGTPIGILKSDGGFLASPVVRLKSKNRPLQTVSLDFGLTLTF